MRIRALLLFVLLAFFTANATVPDTAAAVPCDDECRQRFDFYFCQPNPKNGKCIKFAHETCLFCTGTGSCRDLKDYNPLKPICRDIDKTPLIYHDECSFLCPCADPPQFTQVEATPSGPETTLFGRYSLCRQ